MRVTGSKKKTPEPESESDKTASETESLIVRRAVKRRKQLKSEGRKSRNEFPVSLPRRNGAEFQEELNTSMSRKNRGEVKELSKNFMSRNRRHEFQEASEYCDDFQVPADTEPRRYHRKNQEPSVSEPRGYYGKSQEPSDYGPRRYCGKFQDPSHSMPRTRRCPDEDSRSGRYHTAFRDLAEPKPRRNRAEFPEPNDSRSRRYHVQLQEAREPMPRKERKKEFFHTEAPVPGPAAVQADADVAAWLNCYHRSENHVETKRPCEYLVEAEEEEEEAYKEYEEMKEYEEKEEEEEDEEEEDEGDDDEPVTPSEEKMVDGEEFKFSAREPENAEPRRRAETASTRVVGRDEGRSRGTKRARASDVNRESRSPGLRARAETNSGHQAQSSGQRARPESSSLPQAPISGARAHPHTSSRHPERDNGKERKEEDDTEEQSKIQKKPVPKQKKLLTAMINSIIAEVGEEEAQQEPLVEPSSWFGRRPTMQSFPKKVRFKDDDPEPVSEHDLMVPRLFAESGMNEGLLGYKDKPCQQSGTVWDVIPRARGIVYEHQQEGFEFMWEKLEGTINLAELNKSEDSDIGGCIISHAPGTGKTLLTLIFISAYLKIFPNSRPMIIAPASMLLTWEEEFKKWNVKFPFHVLNNYGLTGEERKIPNCTVPTGRTMNRLMKMYSWTKEGSVLGISYDLFEDLVGGEHKKGKEEISQLSEMYKRMLLEMPRLVIMDEGHTPRNSNSCIWNTVLKLQTKRKVILTGTPFQNNFSELFNMLRLVRPETADSLLKEKTIAPMLAVKGAKYVPKKKKHMESSESVDQAIVKLKDIISPFVHVHKGHILKRSLPGLKDSVLLFKPPPMQKHLIKLIEGSKAAFSSFDYEYKAALISTHPSLAEHCRLHQRERAAINMDEVLSSKDDYRAGVKTRFVMDLVRLSIDQDEKVLVFSQYQQVHKLMAEQLQAFFNWEEGRQVLQIHGKQDQKVRQQLITKFNDPKTEAVVLLASTKCCSEGINLVGASRVVLLDVVWNPSVERQAISRAYRLGQKKVVHTYHLMAAGTSEGEKFCRQVHKDRLSELVFSSTTKENVTEQDPTPATGVDDVILHSMLEDDSFKEMVEKIIYQPKEVDLIKTFTLASVDDQT